MGWEAVSLHRKLSVSIVLVTTLLLVTALVPAPADASLRAPPDGSGLGRTDVRDEPNHPDDQNGFPDQNFQPSHETLVLDGFAEQDHWFLRTDANGVLNPLVHGTDYDSYEEYLLPGFALFGAWWGWWQDTGSGVELQEHGVSGSPDGRIDDAHDDTSTWDDPRQGEWDEFVWRGENPWAGQHGHASYPDDRLLLFVQPGTSRPHAKQMVLPGNPDSGYVLRNDTDGASVPDAEMADRTGYAAYLGGYYENDWGWWTQNIYPHGQYDRSLLTTTTVTTSVNPTEQGDGTYDPLDAERVDVDPYTSLHPQVEELYRLTVWDPGNEEDGPLDPLVGGEGVKQLLKDEWTATWQYHMDAPAEIMEPVMEPLLPTVGAVDDTAGFGPRTHEPNHVDDDYNGHAIHDPATSYGGDPYYDPGPDQDYTGYQVGEHLWLDVQAGWGVPVYFGGAYFKGHLGFMPGPPDADISSEPAHSEAGPGFLYLAGYLGTWHDEDEDTWVGSVDERGRWGGSSDPYAGGTSDPQDVPNDPMYKQRANDPNDYGDTPERTASDPAKSAPGEWRPVCEDGSITATITPTNPDERWGSTGAYVVHDVHGQHNPYDDAVLDVLGDGPWGEDEGEQLSRLVTHGSVDVPMRCEDPDTGTWFGDVFILLPAGSLDVELEVTSVGALHGDRLSVVDGSTNLNGESVVDVDVVNSWT